MSKRLDVGNRDPYYWKNHAHPEWGHPYLPFERHRIITANRQYLLGLLEQSSEQIGYYGTTAWTARSMQRRGFLEDNPEAAKKIGVWPPIVAMEAARDAGFTVLQAGLSEVDRGSVLEVMMQNPVPDPNGNLRWAADPTTTTVERLFSRQSDFLIYLADKAVREQGVSGAYDWRGELAFRGI